jgi:hypothetical protein
VRSIFLAHVFLHIRDALAHHHRVRSITDTRMDIPRFPMKILPRIVIMTVEVWDFPLLPCVICDKASVVIESGVSQCFFTCRFRQ